MSPWRGEKNESETSIQKHGLQWVGICCKTHLPQSQKAPPPDKCVGVGGVSNVEVERVSGRAPSSLGAECATVQNSIRSLFFFALPAHTQHLHKT